MTSSTNHSFLDENQSVITSDQDLNFLSFSYTFTLMLIFDSEVSSSNNSKHKVPELENEEERRERIFHLYPRKKRTPRIKIDRTMNNSPQWLISRMKDMEGSEPKKIAQKTLTKSDVKKGEARLLIPFSKLIEQNFLNQEELRIMEEDRNRAKKIGVTVLVIDQSGSITWRLNLRRWDMKKKDSRKVTMNYVLVSGWNHFVEENNLEENDFITIWSFRSRGALCFAIYHPS